MSKKTPETIQRLLNAFKEGATYNKAAEMAGIARTTLFNWRVEDESLNKQIEEAKVSRVKLVEDALFVSAMKGNTAAQIFFLKNKGDYNDTPMLEQHTHITYGWNNEDNDKVLPAGIPEGNPPRQP